MRTGLKTLRRRGHAGRNDDHEPYLPARGVLKIAIALKRNKAQNYVINESKYGQHKLLSH
jgi:hypothetical protein